MISLLLLEDSIADARLVQLNLESVEDPEFSVVHVTRLEEALQKIGETSFDIILSDLNLPDSKGIDTFLSINKTAPELPVILLTGFNDEEVAMNIIKEGAEDYIVKGEVKGKYLVRAIQYAIERKRLQQKLQEQNEQLEKMLQIDPLTGLYSRRYILSCLDEEVARYNRYDEPLSVIHIDVDDFKHINDDYGHNAGDQALKDVAEYIEENIRETDKAARYGGDEFLVLMPGTDVHSAERVCEKLNRSKIVSAISPDTSIDLSLSIGAAAAQGETTATLLIDTADFAMLAANKAGKGRFFVASDLVGSSEKDDGNGDATELLKETRNTMREVICQLLGASLNEVEREYDILDPISEYMQLLSDSLISKLSLNKDQLRTLNNVIQIIRFQDLGISQRNIKEIDKLSEEKRQVLRSRFLYNIRLLKKVRFLHAEAEVLEQLYENFDGTGFPRQAKGEKIPFLSRFVRVLYEAALEAKEVFRSSTEEKKSISELLRQQRGKTLDPGIADLVTEQLEGVYSNWFQKQGGKVLLIEDDEGTIKLMTRYLAGAGYSAAVAKSFSEGVPLAKKGGWDIIFTDVMLPDGNGLEILSEIKKAGRKPILAVVSARFDDETVNDARTRGADVYMIKPVRFGLLRKLLASSAFPQDEMEVISGLTSITDLR